MWGWFRGLKRWQRYWLASWLVSSVPLLLIALDLVVLDTRVTTTIPVPIIVVAVLLLSVGAWMVEWRARANFTDEHPEFREHLRMWRSNADPRTIGEALLELRRRRWLRRFFYGDPRAVRPKSVPPLPKPLASIQAPPVSDPDAGQVPADRPRGGLSWFRELKQWQRDYIVQWIVWLIVIGLLLVGIYAYRGEDTGRFPLLLLGPFFLLIGYGFVIGGRARAGFLKENPHLRGVVGGEDGIEAMTLTEALIRRAFGQLQKPG